MSDIFTSKSASFILSVMLIFLAACNNEDEPDMPTNQPDSEVFSKSRSTYWSSYPHKDVTMIELHSSVADFEMECGEYPGYHIRLDKSPATDAHGYFVYRVVADMDAIDVTDTNKYITTSFKITLTGTGYKAGRKVTQVCRYTPEVQRYYLADCERNTLERNWYVSQSKTESNLNWVVWNENNLNYSFPSVTTFNFDMPESDDDNESHRPTPYFATLQNDLTDNDSFLYFRHRHEPCFGWPDCETFRCETILNRGCLYFPEYDKKLQIIYINDKKIICTAELTDSSGNLITRYSYTLASY